jgi:hypothetical protein
VNTISFEVTLARIKIWTLTFLLVF